MSGAVLFLLTATAAAPNRPPSGGLAEDPAVLLNKILVEVREMGAHPGEDFIKQEFFIGAPDEDDTNKDTSVIILIQSIDGKERMTIQVTRMERSRSDRRIKTARETRSITGVPDEAGFRVFRSDYEADELESVCTQILRAVRSKKRLIKGSGLNIQQNSIN